MKLLLLPHDPVLAGALRQRGHQVDEFSEIDLAAESLERARPDVMLLGQIDRAWLAELESPPPVLEARFGIERLLPLLAELQPSPEAEIAALLADFRLKLPARIDELKEAIGSRSSSADAEARAISAAHKLAGTGAAYGIAELGKACRALEQLLRARADAAEIERALERAVAAAAG